MLEHRYWVLSRFGEEGRAFVYSIDVLNSALAFYGGVRVAMAGPGLVKAVRAFYGDFAEKARLQRQLGKLTPQDASRLDGLEGATNGLLDELAALRARHAGPVANANGAAPAQAGGKVISLFRSKPPGRPPEAGAQPIPSEAKESLAPTGTDGPTVAFRGQRPTDNTPAASLKGVRRSSAGGENPGPLLSKPGRAASGEVPENALRPSTAAGERRAASPTPAAIDEGPGEWVFDPNESMSSESRLYQSQVTHHAPGYVYKVKGVKTEPSPM